MEEIEINTEYITLGQLIKYVGLIDNGAQAKDFLTRATVLVDGVNDNRRGRKLYPGTQIKINNKNQYIIKQSEEE